MWENTEDGSVITPDGKVVWFSAKRFIRDIGEGDCCFICGASPGSKPFNEEHVFPEWLLRRYSLFNRKITLPNDEELRYRGYTVPCCQTCNTDLGKAIEEPVSAALSTDIKTLNAFLTSRDGIKIRVWVALIFLKTHLKDKQRRVHADSRLGDEKIADDYDWADLHHIHSVVRAIINGYPIDPYALGSFMVLPIISDQSEELFDYMDLHAAQSFYIRLGGVGIFAVFNDSGAVQGIFRQKLDKINGPLSQPQAREVLVELAWLNLHLAERPTHATHYIRATEKCWIETKLPELHWEAWDYDLRSELLRHAFRYLIEGDSIANLSREEAEARIVDATLTFLFDDQGAFIQSASAN